MKVMLFIHMLLREYLVSMLDMASHIGWLTSEIQHNGGLVKNIKSLCVRFCLVSNIQISLVLNSISDDFIVTNLTRAVNYSLELYIKFLLSSTLINYSCNMSDFIINSPTWSNSLQVEIIDFMSLHFYVGTKIAMGKKF